MQHDHLYLKPKAYFSVKRHRRRAREIMTPSLSPTPYSCAGTEITDDIEDGLDELERFFERLRWREK